MVEIIRTSQFKRDVKKTLRRNKDPEKLKIEPDWILIYRIRGNELHLIRTGTHAELFR
ncbi:MAG: type II toxin-antitoxin system mRNA interferase toxin, RelE/StbE family [Verrucomicrobiota bacterium]